MMISRQTNTTKRVTSPASWSIINAFLLLPGMFIVSYLPGMITVSVLKRVIGDDDFYPHVQDAATLFLMINHFGNPIYYIYKLSNIRQGLMDLVKCRSSQPISGQEVAIELRARY